MLTFKIRDNDIISSQYDLERSLINNLFYFFQALPPRFSYEIHLVSSITTQDGFTQKGASHQVQIGKYANGTPKYKTIVNKFAVCDIYVKFDGVVKKKLQRILLAPIDILSYNPSTADVAAESINVPNIISTGISVPQPVLVPARDTINSVTAPAAPVTKNATAPTPPPAPKPDLPPVVPNSLPPQTRFTYQNSVFKDTLKNTSSSFSFEELPVKLKNMVNAGALTDYEAQQFASQYSVPYIPLTAPAPVVSSVGTGETKPGANATTLSEWYSAQGKTLPSVSERSLVYEGFGLGPAGTYIGSAEQNVALLTKLQG